MPEESEDKKQAMEYPSARLLGQVWVAQGLLHVFPSEERVVEFVMQTLRAFPDVRECGMCVEGAIAPICHRRAEECVACLELGNFQLVCRLARETDIWVAPLDTTDKRYGYVQIIPQSLQGFASLKPALTNFFNSIAIDLENRWQRRQLEKANDELREYSDHLNRLVSERTMELRVKNEMLESELAHRELMEEELKRHRDHLEDLIAQRTETLRRTHEQLVYSEKLAALGKLTGSIAHEFNNPIYGVRNIIEQTLEHLAHDEEYKPLLTLARKECNRMASMIRKLQGFYKPSSDEALPLGIHHVLDDVCLLAKKELQLRNITLEKHYCADLPLIVAVEDQLKQVILNLLNNAGEAMPPEGGRITLLTALDSSNVRISIQDTGEGIPPENFSSIFEPFFSTKGVKGTGLGLSVSYGIIKAHGGDIEVKSKIGEGTSFTIILPVAPA